MKFLTSLIAIMAILAVASATPSHNPQYAPSITGACQSTTSRCLGDITFFLSGLGACGWPIETTMQNQIALPYAFMGTQSNSNPYCGKDITIYNPATGNTAQAIVGDKCMGCTDRAIDLTEQLFGQLTNGDFSAGREHEIQWWFS